MWNWVSCNVWNDYRNDENVMLSDSENVKLTDNINFNKLPRWYSKIYNNTIWMLFDNFKKRKNMKEIFHKINSGKPISPDEEQFILSITEHKKMKMIKRLKKARNKHSFDIKTFEIFHGKQVDYTYKNKKIEIIKNIDELISFILKNSEIIVDPTLLKRTDEWLVSK